jgi:hypothetical protein
VSLHFESPRCLDFALLWASSWPMTKTNPAIQDNRASRLRHPAPRLLADSRMHFATVAVRRQQDGLYRYLVDVDFYLITGSAASSAGLSRVVGAAV